MSQVDKFLEIAQAEVGVVEAEGNKVKYNKNNGQPWCGYFVNWCATKAKIVEGTSVWEYGEVYKHFDFVLAPLQDNHFNQCKSELKIVEAALEYSGGTHNFDDIAEMVENHRHDTNRKNLDLS